MAWDNDEFEAVQEWVRQRWNEPDRTDHYLMQIAEMVYLCAGNKKQRDWKVKFEFTDARGRKVKREMTKEEIAHATAQAHARWFAVTGYGKDKVQVVQMNNDNPQRPAPESVSVGPTFKGRNSGK